MLRMGRNWGCFGFMILVGSLMVKVAYGKKMLMWAGVFTMTKIISYSCFVECVYIPM